MRRGLVNGTAQFRFGHQPEFPWICSLGSTAQTNAITCGMRLYCTNGKSQFGTIYTMADLALGGEIAAATDAGYEGKMIKKRGPAKLILSPTCTNPNTAYVNTARVEVVEGTLRNESATALRSVNAVELHDGTVYEAVGTAQSFGKLVVDDKFSWAKTRVGATIRFEQGGTLTLPADGFTLADGALLILEGDVGKTTFRIGTSRGLSAGVLDRIRIRVGDRLGHTVQDENGYLYARVSGCVLVIR